MIPNDTSILGLLHTTGISFYLTGSRIFGGVRDDSDYDFFTQESALTKLWLERNGFKRTEWTHYGTDVAVTDVYIYDDVEVQIHVQLVTNTIKKLAAQEEILHSPELLSLYKFSTKASRSDIWNYLYKKVQK